MPKKTNIHFLIRPHPSEPKIAYIKYFKNKSNIKINFDDNKTVDVVISMVSTYAIEVASRTKYLLLCPGSKHELIACSEIEKQISSIFKDVRLFLYNEFKLHKIQSS